MPAKSLPTRAGDLAVWNFRTLHRASPARVQPVPAEHRKHGVFWGVAQNISLADRYLAHMKTRTTSAYYVSVANVKFPGSYAPEIRSLVRQQSIRVATY